MNYEKIIKSVLDIYKIPSQHLKALETIFWQTLIITTPIIYIANLLGIFNVKATLGSYIYLLYLPIFLAAFIALSPFQAHVIQISGNNKKQFAPIKLIPMGDFELRFIKQFLWLILIMAGFAGLSFLPYLTSLIFIQYGSTSNIFTSFSGLLFLFGLIITIYMLTRTIGFLVFVGTEKELTVTKFFQLTHGHEKSIFLIALLAIAPAIIVAQFVEFGLDVLIQASNNIVLQLFIGLIQSTVRTVSYLLSSYVIWVAMTQYIRQQKI